MNETNREAEVFQYKKREPSVRRMNYKLEKSSCRRVPVPSLSWCVGRGLDVIATVSAPRTEYTTYQDT